MDPNLGLLAASGLASFLLKTTAEWMAFLVLVQLSGSARVRFRLWLTMLLVIAAQWAWALANFVHTAFPAARAIASVSTIAGERPTGLAPAGRIAVTHGVAGLVAQVMVGLLACYAAVVLWRMAGDVAGRMRLARAMRHRRAPQESMTEVFRTIVEETGTRACELWILPGLGSPATLGWLRPRVIVPPVCEGQDSTELQVVFWHELKHVERRDALWNVVVRGCRDILWFHPCVHFASRALNAEREFACDEAVVREHPDMRDIYASCLVRFARIRDLAAEPGVTGIEMASNAALLSSRVRSILSEAQSASRASRVWRTSASVAITAVMAVTVLSLNVLFATSSEPALQLPMVAAANPQGARRAERLANTTLPRTEPAATKSAIAGGTGLSPVPHDEALAAEHRAGLDVLNESSGMDMAVGQDVGNTSGNLNGAGSAHGTASQSVPSWTSVAVDAAERAGPLMVNDHDSDDRH